jgi:KaiC/GvpD/RAD55 family RecA-like ATPase
VVLSSVYPLVRDAPAAIGAALADAVQEREAALLVIDGLTTFHDLRDNSGDFRTFIYELGATRAALRCTTLLTSSGTGPYTGHELPEYTLTDGVVELGRHQQGTQSVRTLKVVKLRGRSPLAGEHSLRRSCAR